MPPTPVLLFRPATPGDAEAVFALQAVAVAPVVRCLGADLPGAAPAALA